jgi:hypothetical protein
MARAAKGYRKDELKEAVGFDAFAAAEQYQVIPAQSLTETSLPDLTKNTDSAAGGRSRMERILNGSFS